MLGDAEQVGERLAVDPAAAVAIDEVRGWPPLLYACYSRWHRIDPGRAAGMAEVVRLLLDAGASPNTNNGARQGYRSALKGSVELNNPDVARVLLEAGANPDQGRPIGEAAGLRDHRCLELLLSHGARVVAGTWTVGAAVLCRRRPRGVAPARRPRARRRPGGPGGDRGAARRGGGRLCRGRRRPPGRRSRPRGLRRRPRPVRASPGGAGRQGPDGRAARQPRRARRQHRHRPLHRRLSARRPPVCRATPRRASRPA